MNSTANMVQAGILREHMIYQKTHTTSLNDVRTLNMWGFDLSNVDIISKLRNVETLSLSLNKISSLTPFQQCFNLQNLYLRQNCISSLKEIDHLCSLSRLSSLMLKDNPISSMPNYRSYIASKLPQLKKLDDIEISSNDKNVDFNNASFSEENDHQANNINCKNITNVLQKKKQDLRRNFRNNEDASSSSSSSSSSYNDHRNNNRFGQTNNISNNINNNNNSNINYYNSIIEEEDNNYNSGNNNFDDVRRRRRSNNQTTTNLNPQRINSNDYGYNSNYDELSEQQSFSYASNKQQQPQLQQVQHNYDLKPNDSKKTKNDSNMLTAVLSLIPELSDDSLQVVLEAIQKQRAY